MYMEKFILNLRNTAFKTEQATACYMQINLLSSSAHHELCTVEQYDRTFSSLLQEH